MSMMKQTKKVVGAQRSTIRCHFNAESLFQGHLLKRSLVPKACLILLAITSLAYAQEDARRGGARGTAARAIGQSWTVGVSEASLYGGPSSAYSVKGRVYEGEKVTILQVTGSQEWVRVSTPAGLQAWIQVSDLRRPQDQLSEDPSRYRRQTEYQYDAQGRRVTLAGSQVGTGQGTGQAPGSAQGAAGSPPAEVQPQGGPAEGDLVTGGSGMVPPSEAIATPAMTPEEARAHAFAQSGGVAGGTLIKLELIPAGFSYHTRRFSSNIGTPPLSGLTSEVGSLSFGARVSSMINEYVGVDGRFVAALGSAVTLPAPSALIGSPETEVNVGQYTGDLQLSGGAPLGSLWLGGVLGAQYYELGYTEVIFDDLNKPFTPLQTHRYIAGIIGGRAAYSIGNISIDARGGVSLPVLLLQSPLSEGQWTSLGFWAQTRVELSLTSTMDFGISLGFVHYGTKYQGPAEYGDFTTTHSTYYTKASSVDQSVEALLSASWKL